MVLKALSRMPLLALAIAMAGCAPATYRALKKTDAIEGVQLRFREGLVGPELAARIERRLAESMPYRVIPYTESPGDRKILAILVDGTDRHFFEKHGLAAGMAVGAAGGTLFVFVDPYILFSEAAKNFAAFPFFAAAGAVAGAAIGIYDYGHSKAVKKRHGYLPLDITAYVALGSDEIAFGDMMKKTYRRVPISNAFNLKAFDGRVVAQGGLGGEICYDEIIEASLEVWADALAKYIARNFGDKL